MKEVKANSRQKSYFCSVTFKAAATLFYSNLENALIHCCGKIFPSSSTSVDLLCLVSFQTKSAQTKLDSISAQLDKVKKEITRLEVGIKSSERDLKKSKDKVDSYEAEIAELQNKMKELSAERQAVFEANQTIKAELDEFEVCAYFFASS